MAAAASVAAVAVMPVGTVTAPGADRVLSIAAKGLQMVLLPGCRGLHYQCLGQSRAAAQGRVAGHHRFLRPQRRLPLSLPEWPH